MRALRAGAGRPMTTRAEMEAALEAVLFVAPEPLPRERLLELFDEPEREEAAQALQAVLERHRGGEDRGLMVEEVGGGLRLATRPELHPYLKRFFQVTGRSRLSMAALETLAIIAYRQPLTVPEISDLRGAQSTTVIKTLLERRMIRIAGRKQVVGKPFLYATTREFLLHFGLGSLGDLPPLEEMEELFQLEGGGEAPLRDREEEVARESAALDDTGDAADEEAVEEAVEAAETVEEPGQITPDELHEELREEAAEEAVAATFASIALQGEDS
jgi:segregation and condensation protein B